MRISSGPANKQREKQAFLDDDYMMYTYKVIPCSRVSTHNWKLCHFAHVGEVAARRRPPACHQAENCPHMDNKQNKECPDGDKCPYAHNTFEYWLHPERYKTTLCNYAGGCTRKFCFFAHAASELRTPISKQQSGNPELGLAKTTSLDTTGSVGTPNSSSSNMSSSSLAQSMHSNWTSATGSPMVAAGQRGAAAAVGGTYINQLQQGGFPAQGLAAGMYLPTGLQQQQQLLTTMIDANGNASLMNAGPPGLSAVMLTEPQLNTALDAVPMPVPNIAVASSSNIWDSTASIALAANIYRAGSTPISATDCGSSFASGFTFDPSSPQTPLAVASLSQVQSPMVPLAAMPAATGNSGTLQLGSLQLALEASQQQQSGQLQQQLLQHLLNIQQQQQQQSSVQRPTSNWPVQAVDSSLLTNDMAAMLNAHTVTLQAPALATSVGGSWPVMQLQQQQLQAGIAAARDNGVQVLSAPQPPCMPARTVHPATAAASSAARIAVVAGNGNSQQGLTGLPPTEATQLSQPFSMLTFRVPQPA